MWTSLEKESWSLPITESFLIGQFTTYCQSNSVGVLRVRKSMNNRLVTGAYFSFPTLTLHAHLLLQATFLATDHHGARPFPNLVGRFSERFAWKWKSLKLSGKVCDKSPAIPVGNPGFAYGSTPRMVADTRITTMTNNQSITTGKSYFSIYESTFQVLRIHKTDEINTYQRAGLLPILTVLKIRKKMISCHLLFDKILQTFELWIKCIASCLLRRPVCNILYRDWRKSKSTQCDHNYYLMSKICIYLNSFTRIASTPSYHQFDLV